MEQLFDHNRTAYEAVINHFNQGNRKACVIHATGTGKSYVIAAVSDHFERVLVMTNNMFTVDEIRDVIDRYSPGRVTAPSYMIYQALLKDMNNDADYAGKFDLIVLDEFHHSGAEQWGKAVEWVMQLNPQAKVLGTSATAIRHSDNMRDMGEELFEGHVLSRLPLGEAWARKVLVAPVYIMAVEDSEEFYNDFIKKIEDSRLLEEKKQYYREMARNLKDNYEMEKNAPEIIRRWLPADSRRVIIFSRNIEEAESNRQKVEAWMRKAGFTIAGIYIVHSDRPYEVKKAQMAAFREDDYTGIKLMVAVDMLNEGVHIAGVDAVFFLRKTMSPTIHLQQMGRCMTRYREGGRRPVVFDFRNNVENVTRSSDTRNFFAEAAKDYDAWKELEEESAPTQVVSAPETEEKLRVNFPDGINYTMDYGVMLDRFGTDLSKADWEANYAEAKVFYVERGHFPTYKEDKRLNAWARWWWNNYLKDKVKYQKKAEMLMAIGFVYQTLDEMFDKKWRKCYEETKAFFEEHGHFPTQNEDIRLYMWARDWWRNNYLKDKKMYQGKAEMLTAIGFVYQTADEVNDKLWRKNYIEAKAFFEEHGHFLTPKENRRLYRWAMNWWWNSYLKDKENNQQKAEMLMAIGFVYQAKDDKWEANYTEAKAFYEEHGHFPTRKENERLYTWARWWWRNTYLKDKENNQQKAEMLMAIGFVYQTVDEVNDKLWRKNYEEAMVFYNEHGHFPTQKEGKGLYVWAMNWWRNNYLKDKEKYQEKAEMLTDIGFVYQSADEVNDIKWMKNYEEGKAFFVENGHFPTPKENRRLYMWARDWWRNNYLNGKVKNQQKAEMLTEIGFEYKGEK